jgi:hypothetical protein
MKEEKFRVWWDEKEEILRLVTMGKVDDEATGKMVEELTRALDARGVKTDLLADVSGQTGFPSAAGRKRSSQFLKHPNLNKTAAVVTSVAIKVAANFIVGAAGYENVKMCATAEEALKWLKEDVENG